MTQRWVHVDPQSETMSQHDIQGQGQDHQNVVLDALSERGISTNTLN